MGDPRSVRDGADSPDRLAEALRALLPLLRTGHRRPTSDPAPSPLKGEGGDGGAPATASHPNSPPHGRRGSESERLDYLEQELREVRTRVNALFFTVLAVALGELAGRLVLP